MENSSFISWKCTRCGMQNMGNDYCDRCGFPSPFSPPGTKPRGIDRHEFLNDRETAGFVKHYINWVLPLTIAVLIASIIAQFALAIIYIKNTDSLATASVYAVTNIPVLIMAIAARVNLKKLTMRGYRYNKIFLITTIIVNVLCLCLLLTPMCEYRNSIAFNGFFSLYSVIVLVVFAKNKWIFADDAGSDHLNSAAADRLSSKKQMKIYNKIEKAKRYLDAGIISQEQFELTKQSIFSEAERAAGRKQKAKQFFKGMLIVIISIFIAFLFLLVLCGVFYAVQQWQEEYIRADLVSRMREAVAAAEAAEASAAM